MADSTAIPAARSWGHSTVQTACPLDCPDSCSLAVTVERGKVIKIDGSHEAPSTDGYICGKVRGFGRRVYGDLRLLHPAIRKGPKGGGAFARVTWDEALDLIAAKMRRATERFGAESILPYYYGGSNGILTNDLEDARFFRRLGASRLARTVCAAPTSAAATAMYGKMPGVAYPDYEAARLIVVWGCNPSASGIHLVAHIKKAQKNGAKLVVIDPRRTPLARQADLHLAVRPGADLPVALAIARELFARGCADLDFLNAHAAGVDDFRRSGRAWTIDRAAAEAGVDPADVWRLSPSGTARRTPAVIRCGWGQERNRNGGSATMAILALPAIGGKFGVRGGGYTMSNSGAWGITAEKLIDVPAPAARVVNMNHLGRALTEYDNPPISVLFVYNCNPLATVPDQNRVRRGLEREDLFTVVFEQVMTDTAPYADVLLPATTFLEHYDIAKGYGAYHLHLVQPVIAPRRRIAAEPRGLSRSGRAARSGGARRRARRGGRADGNGRAPARDAFAGGARGPGRDGPGRRTPGPVRGRASADTGRPRAAVPVDPAEPRAASITTSPIRRPPPSAQSHLTGERAHDLVHARRAAPGRRPAQAASGRCARAIDRRRRHRPRVQRPRRGASAKRASRPKFVRAPSRCRRASGRAARSTAPRPTRSCPTRSPTSPAARASMTRACRWSCWRDTEASASI